MNSSEPMRNRLKAALREGPAGARQLARWLVEEGLPPRSEDDEPYEVILRALSELDDYAPAERSLAQWAAELLDEEPETRRAEPDRDQYLFNLLRLAAALSSPDELWEPPLRMYERRHLAGAYDGLEHRHSLLLALAKNQADTRLRDVWLTMAEGEPDPVLGGTAEDGLWGLTHAPDPDEGRGYPDLAGIGLALDAVMRDGSKHRRERRRLLIEFNDRLANCYPHVSLQEPFIGWADFYRWPDWAVSGLPSLALPLDEDDQSGRASVLIWKVYSYDFLLGRGHVTHTFCSGQLVRMSVDRDTWHVDRQILTVLEERRLASPFASITAIRGDLNQCLMELQLDPTPPGPVHEALPPIRKRFVKTALQHL